MIDFEATVKLIQKDRSGTHSCHPACSKCVGYAHRYVEAALGDEPLYRVDRTRERKRTTDPIEYVQVWSKETDNE